MESIIKKILTGKADEYSHRSFVRFGKGKFERRFLIGYNKVADKIKIKSSFELANDLVKFIKENKNVKFSGKILSKDKIAGKESKKKGGVLVYEINESGIDEFPNPYYALLDVNDSEIILKMKKALPKPGQEASKIDEGFCVLTIDSKYWPKAKETFFWDVPDGKKAEISNTLNIDEIIIPKNEKDPVKMRENAVRKGKLIRIITVDGKETKKEYDLEA